MPVMKQTTPAEPEPFDVPAIVLGTVAAEGSAPTAIRSDATIVALDDTAPVTQASADAAAAGVAAVAARRDHRHGMPTLGGAVTREGGVTVETTTTSTTAVTLLTASALTIAVAEPFQAFVALRKTGGAVSLAFVGITLNATLIITTIEWGSNSNQIQQGLCSFVSVSRATSYLRSGYITVSAGEPTLAPTLIRQDAANTPNVQITDVLITGRVADAAVTMGADELQVYVYAAS